MTWNQKKIIQAAIFALGLLIMLHLLTVLFKPKWYRDEIWEPITQIHDGYYALEEDSVDVFFIGASYVFWDINPLLIWHDFGISSYDLTSSLQRLWISKYYVHDVIKRKHPKVIALEVGVAFNDTPNDEDRNRKALDYMKLSPEKLEAIAETVKRSPEESFTSYIFPILRYHSRWSDLSKNDFHYLGGSKNFFLRGFSPRYHVESVSPTAWRDNVNPTGGVLPDQCRRYLDDIVDACDAANIDLFLFRSPSAKHSLEEHNCIAEYAELHSVPFLDFNLLVDEIELDDTDFNDINHLNINGANKISRYLGNYLVSHYDLRDWSTDEQWMDDYKKFLEYDAKNRLENQLAEQVNGVN